MRKDIIILFFLLLSSVLFSQVNKFGAPVITYYNNEQYDINAQNWAAVKDSKDVMYFGNNSGVLKFDGSNWEKYAVNNESSIFSLAVDNKDIVYVGGTSEFGCVVTNANGSKKYEILSKQLDPKIKFAEVWKTYFYKDDVYFCTQDYIFIFNKKKHKKTIKLPEQSFLTFIANKNIYVTNFVKGLLKLQTDSLVPVKGGDFFIEKNIFGVLPYNEKKLLITTGVEGVYIFDEVLGTHEQFLSEDALNFISKKQAIIYNSSKTNYGEYVFSTLYGGLFITDGKGNIIYHLDKENGLFDNIAICSYQSENGPLWVCLNSGLLKLEINIPLNYFDISKEIDGTLNDMILFKDVLYIATDGGVYYISNKDLYPKLVKTKINLQTWRFKEFIEKNKNVLLVSTVDGLFELSDTNKIEGVENKIKNKNSIPLVTFRAKLIYNLKNEPVVFVFEKKNILYFKYDGENWTDLVKIEFKTQIIEAQEDGKGNLWLVSSFNGIYKASFKNNILKIEDNYNLSNGLKSLKSISVEIFNGIAYFGTQDGFYVVDEKTNKIVKTKLNKIDANTPIKGFSALKSGNYIIGFEGINNNYIYYNEKSKQFDSMHLSILPKSKIKCLFTEFSENKIYAGLGAKIYLINKDKKLEYLKPSKVIFSKIAVADSILYSGITENTTKQVVLDYKYNEITFEFSTPYYFNTEQIEYSYFLEGDDETWSQWTKNNYDKEKLLEGDYTLKVKAKNSFGIESDVSEFSFSINPPWYRKIIAYFIYAILIISFIAIIVYLNNRRLLKDKVRLEKIVKERTAEVVAQKEEIEVQKEEIEVQRDLVLEQKEKIEIIHKEITDSIHYAERIQRAILPAEEHVNKAIPEHFILFKPKDIVSGDYYWASVLETENNVNKGLIGKLVITAADCTGHGVPGAFMSMLGVSFLNEIVNEKGISQSNIILNMMRENVIASLQQTGAHGEQKDGMDIALLVIDVENKIVQFSGANNPLYLIRKKTLPKLKINTPETEIKEIEENENCDFALYEIKPNKMPIAIYVVMDSFRLNEMEVMSGDALYIFSDGYADQFGGKDGKKFKYKPFKELLLKSQTLTMNEQKNVLNEKIENWKSFINPSKNAPYEQIDDIVVIGIKIP